MRSGHRFVAVVTTCLTIASALLLASPEARAQTPGVSGERILLGQSVALSGPLGVLGTPLRDGARLYFDHVNAQGGVHGRKIELLSVDDAYKPEQTVAVVKKLVQEQQIFALFNPFGTGNTLAVLPWLSEQKVPVFAPYTGSDTLRKHNPYLFHLRASYGDEAEQIIKQYHGLGIENVAAVYQDNDFGKSGLAGLEAALARRKLKPVASAALALDGSNVKEAVAKIAATQPQAVVMLTAGKATSDFIGAYQASGQLTQFFCLSVVSSESLGKALGDKARGIAVAQVMPLPTNAAVPIVKDYQALMKAAGRSDLSYAGLEGYISARALVEALRRSGRELTRERLVSTLETMQRVDLGGFTMSYSPTDHTGARYVDLTMVSRGGQFIR